LVALQKAVKDEFHLIILDIMIPNMDGFEMVKRLRTTNNAPILMLSAKSEDIDKIQGLSIGTSDYLTKPFSPMELVARVKSMLCRYMSLGEYEKKTTASQLVIDGLVLDKDLKTVTIDGTQVKLTGQNLTSHKC
jgi:DNA-binding response OmpR family regulator